MVFAPVADVFSRMTADMTVLRLQAEDGMTTLRLTPEHPAYVEGKGWVPAGALSAGDEIIDYNDGTPLTVVSVVYEETTERVYNFEVEGTHSYFAGDVGAWVHNAFTGGPFWSGLSPFRNKLRRDGKGNIFSPDFLHDELEKFNKRGKHLGAVCPKTGSPLKPADKSRRIKL